MGQHLKSSEGRLGGENLVLVAQEGSDDVRHDAVRAAARDHVGDLGPVFLRQLLAQIEAAVGVVMQVAQMLADRFQRPGRRPQRVFVRGQPGDALEAVGPLDFGDGPPRFVGLQRGDIGRNQGHLVSI